MKIEPQVIEALQSSVKAHWTAIHFYKLLSAQTKRWGYSKLSDKYGADVSEETGHLDKLVARIELADVAPTCDLEHVEPARHDQIAQLNQALTLERSAADIERAGIATARQAMDEGSAVILAENLEGSEDSIKSIEAELLVITQIGLGNYLANQI